MGTVFQPYEAHIKYQLQFMVDYNLYGCNYINCENVYFRQGVPDTEEVSEKHRWHNWSIPQKSMLPENEFPRQAFSGLEVDIQTQDIMNRREISQRDLHQNFLECLNPIPPDKKLLHSLAELWKDENRRRGSGDQLNMEGLIVSSGSREPSVAWMHEEDKRIKIDAMIQAERGNGPKPSFRNLVSREPLENLVQTVLESVKDFFPGRRDIPVPEDDYDDNGVDFNDEIIGELGEGYFGEGDDNVAANIDKKVDDPLADEQDEGEDKEVQEADINPSDKEDKEKKVVDEPMGDVTALDENRNPDSEGDEDEAYSPTYLNEKGIYEKGIDLNFDDSELFGPLRFTKKSGAEETAINSRKRSSDEFEDDSYQIPRNRPTKLKRSNPPDIPTLKHTPKYNKIGEVDTGNAFGPFENVSLSSVFFTPLQNETRVQENLENTSSTIQPSKTPKQVSIVVDLAQVPSSPPMSSPWEFPELKAETLRLSQETCSKSQDMTSSVVYPANTQSREFSRPFLIWKCC